MLKDGTLHTFNYSKEIAGFLLWVEKGIVTEDFRLIGIKNWKDTVFEPDYKLPTLNSIEAFIKKNKHLPGILSAKQVLTEGYSVPKMQLAFLEKIEELYLYTLDQEKRIIAQDKKINEQNKKILQMEAYLKTLGFDDN